MDNFSVVSEVDAVGSGLKNIATSVRNKAKAKKAQKISDAGGYMSLTPFQKSLINVPDYILNQTTGTNVTSQEIKDLPASESGLQYWLKANMMIIITVVLVGIVVYYIVKRK